MADETLNQEDKKISEGSRTLGEVVNGLPIVKYLITTLPEKLSNFNFLGSVIAELNKQDFRPSNSYEGTTLLTQEEIDFITREGISQIEDRISEDITREQNGIVIVGGRIDAEASFIQQEANNMSVEDAGQYFVDYKKVEASVQEKYGNIIEAYPELKGYFIEREKEQEEKKIKFEELFRDGFEVRKNYNPRIVTPSKEQLEQIEESARGIEDIADKNDEKSFLDYSVDDKESIEKALRDVFSGNLGEVLAKSEVVLSQVMQDKALREVMMMYSLTETLDPKALKELLDGNDHLRELMQDKHFRRIGAEAEKNLAIQRLKEISDKKEFNNDIYSEIISSLMQYRDDDIVMDLINQTLANFVDLDKCSVISSGGKRKINYNLVMNELDKRVLPEQRVSRLERAAAGRKITLDRLHDTTRTVEENSVSINNEETLRKLFFAKYAAELAKKPDGETISQAESQKLFIEAMEEDFKMRWSMNPKGIRLTDCVDMYYLLSERKNSLEEGKTESPADKKLRKELEASIRERCNIDPRHEGSLYGYYELERQYRDATRRSPKQAAKRFGLKTFRRVIERMSKDEFDKAVGEYSFKEQGYEGGRFAKTGKEYISQIAQATELDEIIRITAKGTRIFDVEKKTAYYERLLQENSLSKDDEEQSKFKVGDNSEKFRDYIKFKTCRELSRYAVLLNKKNLTDMEILDLAAFSQRITQRMKQYPDTKDKYGLINELAIKRLQSDKPELFNENGEIDRTTIVAFNNTFRPTARSYVSVTEALREYEIAGIRKELEDARHPTEKDMKKSFLYYYKQNFSLDSEITQEFTAIEKQRTRQFNKKLLESIDKIERNELDPKDPEFMKLVEEYVYHTKTMPEEYRPDVVKSSRTRRVATFLKEHASDYEGMFDMYKGLNHYSRSLLNMEMGYSREADRDMQMMATERTIVKLLQNPDTKTFSLSDYEIKRSLEVLAYRMAKSEDDPDYKGLEELMPYLGKVDKRLENIKDGKIDPQIVLEAYADVSGKTFNRISQLAEQAKTSSNKKYEKVTINRDLDLIEHKMCESIINEEISKGGTREEISARIQERIDDLKSKPRDRGEEYAELSELAAFRAGYKTVDNVIDIAAEQRKRLEYGKTQIKKYKKQKVNDPERAEALMSSKRAYSEMTTSEQREVYNYFENALNSEDLDTVLDMARRITNVEEMGEDVANIIRHYGTIHREELKGTADEYIHSHPELARYNTEICMNVYKAIERAETILALNERVGSGKKIDREDIGLITHAIKFHDSDRTTSLLGLQHAMSFIPKEKQEGLIVRSQESGFEYYDMTKILELLREEYEKETGEKFEYNQYTYGDDPILNIDIGQEDSIIRGLSERADKAFPPKGKDSASRPITDAAMGELFEAKVGDVIIIGESKQFTGETLANAAIKASEIDKSFESAEINVASEKAEEIAVETENNPPTDSKKASSGDDKKKVEDGPVVEEERDL